MKDVLFEDKALHMRISASRKLKDSWNLAVNASQTTGIKCGFDASLMQLISNIMQI